MNAGLNRRALAPDYASQLPDEVSLEQIKRDINRGYIIFCRKRGLDPDAFGMRTQINSAARSEVAQQELNDEPS